MDKMIVICGYDDSSRQVGGHYNIQNNVVFILLLFKLLIIYYSVKTQFFALNLLHNYILLCSR